MSPDDEGAEVRGVDPWGLAEVEQLLTGLEGVGSLKLVPDGHGGIDEVHVVSDHSASPKQIVRNIESALLAEFGLQIDHRKISVAQVRQPDIARDQEEDPKAAAATDSAEGLTGSRWLLLEELQIDRNAGQSVTCQVTLSDGEDRFEGSAEGPDFLQSRLETAGRAVLEALGQATLEDVALRLEGVKQVEIHGRELVVSVVQGQEQRRSVTLPGTSLVTDSPEEAAVLACLQATNRWAGAA